MPKTIHYPTSQHTRRGIHAGKRKQQINRRKASFREKAEAPAVVANSPFALKLGPKSWGNLSDQMKSKEDSQQPSLHKDLVMAYNQGAKLIGIEVIKYNSKNSTIAGITEVLNLFKQNICPAGFEVNIDEHYNKKSGKTHYHFTMFNSFKIEPYWHFFEIKHIINKLRKTNKKLHDLFIVFLKAFITNCRLPTWFQGPPVYAEEVLADYVDELRNVIKNQDKEEVTQAFERTGYTLAEMQKRISDIEKTMKEYTTGQAAEYRDKITNSKTMEPHFILRSLKKFPSQNKIVKFMKSACELMKEKVGLMDFCYHYADGDDDDGLRYDEQVSIIWDWSDHLSGSQAKIIQDASNSLGVFAPTLSARILPDGVFGLNMKQFINSLQWPGKLSELQIQFQNITKRFTDYDNDRNLL